MRAIHSALPGFILGGLLIAALGFYVGKSFKKDKVLPGTMLPPVAGSAVSKKNDYKEKLRLVTAPLQAYAKKKGYNSRIVFLADMSLASGENRFFVYNMENDSVERAGLVTHGYGSYKGEPEFSNEPGSYCTSLGKYKIGGAYTGRFGLAFKLYGLDKTNSKAFERYVVLHAHDCVPETEVAPLSICKSQGCPTVSPAFLQVLKSYIENSGKPVLLNIYQ